MDGKLLFDLFDSENSLKIKSKDIVIEESKESFGEVEMVQDDAVKDLEKVFDLEKVESATIEEAIKFYRNNMTKVAKVLGIGRSTLYKKIKKYRIQDF